MSFTQFKLAAPLVRAAQEMGFEQPTAVQQLAIPEVLRGTDLLVRAQTGSGKTAAFALPLLSRLHTGEPDAPRRLKTLVLVPTRELAAQVGEVFRALARHLAHRLKVGVAFGGVSINPQMMALRGGADVLVATPGRLLDLHAHNAVKLGQVQALVLDEADRLLDLGFADEVQRILALLPEHRQNLFFSATFEPGVQALASALLQEPVHVQVEHTAVAPEPLITQRAISVDVPRRTQLLKHLMKAESWESALVFVASQYTAEHVANKLYQGGVVATAFHGGLSQGARQQVLQEFKEERWDVLVTTDLAARGIDLAGLPVVVNYDLPRSPTDYIHRIGRTGRAGHRGVAVSFVSADSEPHFRLIEKRQGLSVPRETMPGFEPVELGPPPSNDPADPRNGGIKGRRPSKKDKLRAAGLLPAKPSGD
jgi:ATP-dependent RNA helicase RhlE